MLVCGVFGLIVLSLCEKHCRGFVAAFLKPALTFTAFARRPASGCGRACHSDCGDGGGTGNDFKGPPRKEPKGV